MVDWLVPKQAREQGAGTGWASRACRSAWFSTVRLPWPKGTVWRTSSDLSQYEAASGWRSTEAPSPSHGRIDPGNSSDAPPGRQGYFMAYNDFTLEALKKQFGLQTNERQDYFGRAAPVPISDFLREYLRENIPLAFAIGTEKARSELLIMPVLWEVRHQLKDSISLFSGVEFNVSIERGLRGVCDFLLSLSPTCRSERGKSAAREQ